MLRSLEVHSRVCFLVECMFVMYCPGRLSSVENIEVLNCGAAVIPTDLNFTKDCKKAQQFRATPVFWKASADVHVVKYGVSRETCTNRSK